MTVNKPQSRPAPEPETQSEKKTPEELKAEALKKKEAGKKAITKETKGKLDTMLGGDFGLLMRKLFKTFGKFLSSFDGIKDNIGNILASQSPEEIRKITDKSKDYKVPSIDKPEEKVTTIEDPNPKEKLVAYLYRCLKIQQPTPEQLSPHKKLDIRHLMFQLMHSFQFAKGKKDIIDGFTKKPQKFYKDDIVFFRNSLNGDITAGFVQKIGEYTVTVTTLDETGTKRTIPMYKNMCLMAFHIPGNKTKGTVPIKKKKKPEYKVDF